MVAQKEGFTVTDDERRQGLRTLLERDEITQEEAQRYGYSRIRKEPFPGEETPSPGWESRLAEIDVLLDSLLNEREEDDDGEARGDDTTR